MLNYQRVSQISKLIGKVTVHEKWDISIYIYPISKHGNVIVTHIGSLWTHDTMSWLKATEKDAKITKKE